jgi:hypothetical protein
MGHSTNADGEHPSANAACLHNHLPIVPADVCGSITLHGSVSLAYCLSGLSWWKTQIKGMVSFLGGAHFLHIISRVHSSMQHSLAGVRGDIISAHIAHGPDRRESTSRIGDGDVGEASPSGAPNDRDLFFPGIGRSGVLSQEEARIGAGDGSPLLGDAIANHASDDVVHVVAVPRVGRGWSPGGWPHRASLSLASDPKFVARTPTWAGGCTAGWKAR